MSVPTAIDLRGERSARRKHKIWSQQFGLFGQAATCVLLRAETATAPPSTAKASAAARTRCFIGGSRLAVRGALRTGGDMRGAEGGDDDCAADHGECQRQSKGKLFHRRFPSFQQSEVPCGQAATCVLLRAETATAPPTTARARARARASFFIGRFPGLAVRGAPRTGGDMRGAEGGDPDRAADHGKGDGQGEEELFHQRLRLKIPQIRVQSRLPCVS